MFRDMCRYAMPTEEATKVWLNEVGLELPRASEGGSLKKIRQLADVGRFLNRLLGEPLNITRAFRKSPPTSRVGSRGVQNLTGRVGGFLVSRMGRATLVGTDPRVVTRPVKKPCELQPYQRRGSRGAHDNKRKMKQHSRPCRKSKRCVCWDVVYGLSFLFLFLVFVWTDRLE